MISIPTAQQKDHESDSGPLPTVFLLSIYLHFLITTLLLLDGGYFRHQSSHALQVRVLFIDSLFTTTSHTWCPFALSDDFGEQFETITSWISEL